MTENYRVRVKRADLEVEIESTDKKFIEAKLAEYLSQAETGPVAAAHHQPSGASPGKENRRRPLSIGEFSKQASPDKKNEIAATIAYYLEFHGDIEEWKPDDISDKFTDVRKSKPANMTDLLQKSDFFMKGRGPGFYRLSETGVRWVQGKVEKNEE